MSVTIRGIDNAVASVGRFASTSALADAAEAGCFKVGDTLTDQYLSGQSVRIRSGRLINSWLVRKYETPAPGADLFTGVFYARFLNYGTSRIRARGFLKAALDNSRDRVREAILDTWRSSVGN